VEASYLAMNKGWAINLSGGFHHARSDNGEGFCIYPDITFITHFLKKHYGLKRILIIDLDAHQGNGHERDHLEDPDIYIIDAYNHSIYPGDTHAEQAIKHDIDIHRGTTDESFLEEVDEAMAKAVKEFQPQFVVYNAGTDCLIGDPLGRVSISHQGIIDRDETVFKHCLKTVSPIKQDP